MIQVFQGFKYEYEDLSEMITIIAFTQTCLAPAPPAAEGMPAQVLVFLGEIPHI